MQQSVRLLGRILQNSFNLGIEREKFSAIQWLGEGEAYSQQP